MRRCLFFVVLMTAVTLSMPIRPTSAAATEMTGRPGNAHQFNLDELFQAYVEEGRPVLVERVRTRQDLPDNLTSIRRSVEAWRSDWRPIREVFLLDLADRARAIRGDRPLSTVGLSPPISILLPGLSLFAARRSPFGTDPTADSLERDWVRAAIAMFDAYADGEALRDEQDFLDAAASRYRAARVKDVDPRLILALATTASNQCCRPLMLITLENERRDVGGHFGLGSAIEKAVALFDAAANFPSVRVEARVRGAFLLIHLGRPDEALQWLDQIEDGDPDRELLYWGYLFRGRANDDLGHFEAAAVAYRAALTAWPTGQSAAVALALDFLKLGRLTELADVGEGAVPSIQQSRQTPTWGRLTAPVPSPPAFVPVRAGDPWAQYEFADARFFSAWLAAVREGSR